MELPLMLVMPMTAAAERTGTVIGRTSMRYWSMSIVAVPARLTRMKVRRPAECRLLERSQPMMAARTMLMASRRKMEPSVSSALHGPRSPAIQSVFMLCYLLR